MSAKRRKKKNGKRKVIIVIVEILILLIVLAVLFVMQKMSKIDSGNKADISGEMVEINDLPKPIVEMQEERYTTIALFGLDNRSTGQLDRGNSDVIIVASIDEETKDVRMASIYRDTYLNLTNDDGYSKCNAAYARGGPSQAVSMLNVNFDLSIDDYVAFDFRAVADAIDLLGGVEIELTNAEADGINGYIDEVAKLSKKKANYIYSGGTYNMDGVQATAYARIRYTAGSDYKRTERQRLVIQKMVEKALKSDLATINSLVDTIFPEIKTSLTNTEILMLAKDAFGYSLGENAGFPQEKWAGPIGKAGDVVIACELVDNVKLLHEFLFPDEEGYTPSSRVQEISDEIVEKTGIDASKAGM